MNREELQSILSYDPSTGEFTWAKAQGAKKQGAIAGCIRETGYKSIRFNKRLFLAHRLAWFWVHGEWPSGQLDHINGVRGDNRIENLREATDGQNKQNQRRARKDNQSGVLGVTPHQGRWRARIGCNGEKRLIGVFESKEEAHAAYLKAKAELHPFQTIAEAA